MYASDINIKDCHGFAYELAVIQVVDIHKQENSYRNKCTQLETTIIKPYFQGKETNSVRVNSIEWMMYGK